MPLAAGEQDERKTADHQPCKWQPAHDYPHAETEILWQRAAWFVTSSPEGETCKPCAQTDAKLDGQQEE